MHDKRRDAAIEYSHAPAYRPDIDGLRAFAVLSVIAYHAAPSWLRGGFIGVDVFFVISGYLISGHIFSALERGKFSLLDFYGRRIRRIFPALIVVLAASFAFAWAALLVDEFEQFSLHVAAGAGFVSNLVLWQESGYFDNTSITKPLLHLWSLGIEEQFYIAWPLVAWALWKSRSNAMAAIAIFAALSFALNTTFFQTDPSLAFYHPLTRFWELLMGAALANRERSAPFRSQSPILANAQAAAGGAMIFASLVLIQEGINFPGWWALLPVAGTALIIAGGPATIPNRLLGARPLAAIGLISFPLYLWHWPLLSFAHIVEGETPSQAMRVALVAATFFLSAATYALIERPLRFGRYQRVKTAALIGAMTVVGAAGLWGWHSGGAPDRPAIVSMADANAQFSNAIWRYSSNEICLDRYPFEEASTYTYWFCIQNRDAAPTVLLLGNSFANHLYPGLAGDPAFANDTILSIGTCPPMMVAPTTEQPDDPSPCDGYRWYNQQEFIKGIIETEGTIRLAVLDGIDDKATPSVIERVRQWADYLEQRDIRVVILTSHARPEGDIRGCFDRPFRRTAKDCGQVSDAIASHNHDFAPLVESMKITNPKVLFFDQNAVFCETGKCSYVSDGKPLIRDEYGHYSEYASGRLARLFASWIAAQ